MAGRILYRQTHRPWRRPMAGAALVLAAAIPWYVLSPDEPPARPATPVALAPEPAPAPVAQAEPVLAPAPAAPVADPVTCPHQKLDLAWGPQNLVACTSATRTRQTGSVRSLLVNAEGTSRWSLRVDTAGGRVVAARLAQRAEGREPAAEFGCAGNACTGFAIGPPDRHGMRVLAARDVRLVATRTAAGDTDPAAAGIVLQAALQIAPDRQNPALACAVPHLDVVRSDGGAAEFCPAGGAGFELSPDAHTDFVFHDLEGRRLSVTLGSDGALLRASYGTLACEASRCGGISMQVQGDAADPGSQRTFSFAGTTLTDPRNPGASARLEGQLTMPAQE